MDLSVIIVNYNVRQFLENALTSLQRAMEGLEGEIMVVDNASDDGSVEMVKEKFPDVRLIESRRNVGFAKANNMALRYARGRFILLINPDTIVQEDTLKVMLRFFEDNPDAGLAGCKILNPDGTFQLACRRSFPTPWVAFTKIVGLSALFPRIKLFGKYNLTYLNPDETYEVDAVSGSFMMIRREVYEQIGGLDESFFMYGEDLDWCYRVAQAGSRVYYVPGTKIVHFKGESTRRSDLDEIRVFYQAMQLFVEKHLSSSMAVEFFLSLGIFLRAMVAFAVKASPPILFALLDAVLVNAALVLSGYLYFGGFPHLPDYAYPVVWMVPALVVVASTYVAGAYTTRRYSVSRSAIAVLAGYIMISAMVFFAKDFAFSRAVVLISGFLSFLLLPGWRLLFRAFGRAGAHMHGRKSLFGRRTVIVGTGLSAQEVLRKLRARVDGGYDVLGFIGTNRKQLGERIGGVEVIGSVDNVGKVISESRVSEVIFATDGLSYMDILSVIGRSNDRSVNFRLVPTSLEAIIGKTRIDELDDIPLVEIEYNLHKPLHRLVKRAVDVGVSLVLMLTVYPFARLRGGSSRGLGGPIRSRILLLPQVFSGRISLVGRPLEEGDPDGGAAMPYLGPRGLTGLVQINRRDGLQPEEVERYKLYYAKNQSFVLDLEILAKTILLKLKP